jgi:hypothetical protein
MIPEIKKVLDDWRSKNRYDCEVGDCPHQPLCAFYEEIQSKTKHNMMATGDDLKTASAGAALA